jgi:branched-chain amino acid transport system permease protein
MSSLQRLRSALIPLLLILCALPIPYLFGPYVVAILIIGGIYTILTVGLNLFMGHTGQISFGHNAFAAIGGYGSAILTTRLGWDPAMAILAAATAAAAGAVVIGYPTLRLKGHYLAMATLAFGLIVRELAVQLDFITYGFTGISGIPPLGIGGWEVVTDRQTYYAVLAVVVIAMWTARRIEDSRVGRALRAIAGNEDAARSLGVDAAAYKLLALVISAVYGAVAGSLLAHHLSFISPEVFGLYAVVLMFTMLFVGGIGTTYGPLVGALLISFLPEMLREFKEARELVYGALLLTILLFYPRGICAPATWERLIAYLRMRFTLEGPRQ